MPSTVTLTSNTNSSGACTVINILQDNLEEGAETFNVIIVPATASQAVVVEERSTALVTIEELCESLAAPLNGSVDDSTRTIGTVANYSCDDQFLLSGDVQRTCLVNGTWSGDAPDCLGNKKKKETANTSFYT